jgi:predicted lysophospholipase L1 biosynthesis ABC-type transport system permease subunit
VSLLEGSAPGTAAVSQVWIRAPGTALDRVRADVESSPAASASVSYRADIARALADDPVATRSVTLLTVAGAIALALAMVAVATAVRADLQQTAADQFALEVDGLTTARLRLVALLRAGLILVAGIPIGVLGGLALTALAVRLLVTGPGGARVEPALRVVFGLGPTLLVVAAAVAGGLFASAGATAASLRRSLPRQPEVDLR